MISPEQRQAIADALSPYMTKEARRAFLNDTVTFDARSVLVKEVLRLIRLNERLEDRETLAGDQGLLKEVRENALTIGILLTKVATLLGSVEV